MPYTPDPTDVANPIDGVVKAATAGAEFRALKTYLRDVLLAGIIAKAPIASPTFTGTGTFNNLAYTGTLTGGVGIVDFGSGQFYKTAGGNVGIGNATPPQLLSVGSGAQANPRIRVTGSATSGIEFNDSGTSVVLSSGNTLDISTSGLQRWRVDNFGRLSGTAMHNNAGGASGASYVASGTYTPTFTPQVNVATASAFPFSWIRVGNVVTVSGAVYLTLSGGIDTQFALSFPIASASTGNDTCNGAGYDAVSKLGFGVRLDGANQRAQAFGSMAAAPLSGYVHVTFTYLVT